MSVDVVAYAMRILEVFFRGGLQIGCGVAVEFATTDGHYCVTWAKENKQLSVAMPGGSMMYAVGNTVTFDPTDGSKKYDPLQSEDNERKHGPFTNTNGLYIFDVVRNFAIFPIFYVPFFLWKLFLF
jgi:hypothetical protein